MEKVAKVEQYVDRALLREFCLLRDEIYRRLSDFYDEWDCTLARTPREKIIPLLASECYSAVPVEPDVIMRCLELRDQIALSLQSYLRKCLSKELFCQHEYIEDIENEMYVATVKALDRLDSSLGGLTYIAQWVKTHIRRTLGDYISRHTSLNDPLFSDGEDGDTTYLDIVPDNRNEKKNIEDEIRIEGARKSKHSMNLVKKISKRKEVWASIINSTPHTCNTTTGGLKDE